MRDIALSCDDNGAKFLRVTVWSLLRHYKGDEPLRINVFEGFGGHSAESKSKLEALVREENRERKLHCTTTTTDYDFFSVRYINVEKAIEPYADLIMNRANSRWNVFTWAPIFAPMLLADATGNVAHFDIDMLFNDDVSKILDLDLGDNLIAAVAEYGKGDPVITEAVWGKGILPPEAERYFNTGTIVFNTAKCREERTWEKILAWYRDHYDIADRIEQDAWNALYWKRTKLLPLRWNFHDRLIKGYPKRDPKARFWQGNPPRECLEAALDPAILHFWGPKKPWKTCHRPYRAAYHEAMRAVGQVPPKEPLLASYYDFTVIRTLERLRGRLEDKSGIRRKNLAMQQLLWGSRQRRKAFKHTLIAPLEWVGIGLGLLVLSNLPRRAMLMLCDFLSAVMYAFDRSGREQALANLRIVFPRAGEVTVAERRILRRSYRNMARTIGHIFWTFRSARERVARAGEMCEAGRIFLRENRPAVTVSGHLGCWEILSQLACLEGHSMMSVAKRIGTPRMTELLIRARRSVGQEIVVADGAFRFLLRGIRAGKSLGLLVDQSVSPEDGGLWVRFLGHPIPVSAAPAFFSAKGKAPIVVAWSRPLGDGRYRCEVVDTIAAEEAKDVWSVTQRIATDLERLVRRHPSCWVMNCDFFDAKPTPAEIETLERRLRDHGLPSLNK